MIRDGTGTPIGELQDGVGAPIGELHRVTSAGDLELLWQYEDDGPTPTGDINLAPFVPDRAVQIRDEAPEDIREDLDATVVDAEDYDDRDGDLGPLLGDASEDGELVDLAEGRYEIETRPDVDDFFAVAGDGAEIHLVEEFNEGALLNASGCHELYLQGLNFHPDVDNALLTTFNTGIRDYAFIEDVQQVGTRDRVGGNGHRMNFLLNMQEDGESFVHRLNMPDGDEPYDDTYDGYCIPVSADPPHEGYNVWKDCYVSGFYDNGFYVFGKDDDTGEPNGPNILWDVTAYNNARGNIRVGDQDVVIGGQAIVDEQFERVHEQGQATPFVQQEFEAEVYGLEIHANGDDWGGHGIQIRSEHGFTHFEKCAFHFESGNSLPVRVDGDDATVEIEDMWFMDETSQFSTFGISSVFNNPGSVEFIGDDNELDTNSTNAFEIGSNGTLITADGEEFSDQTVSAEQAGIEADLSADAKPEYYFDFSEA